MAWSRSLLSRIKWFVGGTGWVIVVMIIKEALYDRAFNAFNTWVDRQFDISTRTSWVSSTAAWVVDYELFEWVAFAITLVVGLVIFCWIYRRYFRDIREDQNDEPESLRKWVNIATPGIVGVTAVVMAVVGMKKNKGEREN